MANRSCPICNRRYFDIRRSEKVCEIHENWLVTTCEICGRVCFSDCAGICLACFDKCSHGQGPIFIPGSPDHRAYLRAIGQDDSF